MKIVIISAIAPPEPLVTGRVNWDIALHLSSCENEIIFISPPPSRPIGKFKKDESFKFKHREVSSNFLHVTVNSFVSPEYNLIKRAYEGFDFSFKAMRYLRDNHSNIDFIYATTWPFVGQLVLVLFNKKMNIPIIMNIQDLYPESFFNKYNSFLHKILAKPLYAIDNYITKNSAHLTVVSESIKHAYLNSRKVFPEKITVIENWQDETIFLNNNILKDEVLEKYNLQKLKSKFIFLYLGNIGPVAGLENVIQDISKLDSPKFSLLIAGNGTAKNKCIELVDKLKIDYVYFIDLPIGMNPVVELQSIADVLLLPILPEASNSSIPSKLIAYMLSSKPILTSAQRKSFTGRAIIESQSGFFVNEDESWSQQMLMMSKLNKDILIDMGKNSFNYAIKNYSRSDGVKKIEKLLKRIA